MEKETKKKRTNAKETNNLVKIAKVLIDIREERKLHDVPDSTMGKYPEGSLGIVIDEKGYIVLNTKGAEEVKGVDKVYKIKEESLKYNPHFYISTHETDEPGIIDDAHNKNKLIDEAYTEVAFLPKNIETDVKIDLKDAKKALGAIIDQKQYSDRDFNGYDVVESKREGDATDYDEIYRCRCVFYDISGNERVESLLIKAFKVSNEKGKEYVYRVVESDRIKGEVEEIEKRAQEESSTIGSSSIEYSKISEEGYIEIESHIKQGIEKYYQDNSHKFYRLIKVDVKAIYSLRLKKNPVLLELLNDGRIKASMGTYYSLIAGDFNVFACPNCYILSSSEESENSKMKIHIDYDFVEGDEKEAFAKYRIGCNNCMQYCSRCGAWHFKLKEIKGGSSDYDLITKKRFLFNYAGRERDSSDFCDCKENLSWVYDEMTLKHIGHEEYYEGIIDRFLTSNCKLVFVNDLTGEVIAKHNDFLLFLDEYLSLWLKNERAREEYFGGKGKDKKVQANTRVVHFAAYYLANKTGFLGDDFKFETYVKSALGNFKNALAEMLNISEEEIKITTSEHTRECSICNNASYYYKEKREEYYNVVHELCASCENAISKKQRSWVRVDGVSFYKPQNRDVAVRTFQTSRGEIIYEDWLKKVVVEMRNNLKEGKKKERKGIKWLKKKTPKK